MVKKQENEVTPGMDKRISEGERQLREFRENNKGKSINNVMEGSDHGT